MEITSEFGGNFFMINDTQKHKSILLPRSCVKKLFENEKRYGNIIRKCMKGVERKIDEHMPLNVENQIFISIEKYEGQVRIDLRVFAPKENNTIQPTKGGINFSVESYLSTMRQLKHIIDTTKIEDDDDDDDDGDEVEIIETPSVNIPKKRKSVPKKNEKKTKVMKKETISDEEDVSA